MSRTKESAVIQYFEDAPIEVATAVLDIIKGKIKARTAIGPKAVKKSKPAPRRRSRKPRNPEATARAPQPAPAPEPEAIPA